MLLEYNTFLHLTPFEAIRTYGSECFGIQYEHVISVLLLKKVKKMKVKALLVISALFTSQAALAVSAPTYESDSTTENRIYAGLVFDLDGSDGFVPDLVVGARTLHVKSSDSVEGADLSARVSYGKHDKGITFDSARLVYVGGERDVIGNIGIGYSNTHSSFLGTIAVQGPYTRLGTDFEFGKNKFEPYLEVNTLDKPDNVEKKESTPIR